MIRIDYSLPTPEGNVAFDQALLDVVESNELDPDGEKPLEFLRFWTFPRPFVVMGRSGKFAEEAHVDRCERDGVPILRRASGGGTILTGPGCLMYAVVLSLKSRPFLRDISQAHRFVGDRLQTAFQLLGVDVQHQGHSDLCQGPKKFSGNALRLGRENLLYHGTVLLAFDLEAIGIYLKPPPRQPEYRDGRDHLDFVTNVSVTDNQLRPAIAEAFEAGAEVAAQWTTLLQQAADELVRSRYSLDSWNRRL